MRIDILRLLTNIRYLVATEEPGSFVASIEIDICHVDNIFDRVRFYDFILSIIPLEVIQHWCIDFNFRYHYVHFIHQYVFNLTTLLRV